MLYAGEFVLLPSEQQPGGVALFIDNNSGTYAPSKALLPAVRDLLQYNLPGLEVRRRYQPTRVWHCMAHQQCACGVCSGAALHVGA